MALQQHFHLSQKRLFAFALQSRMNFCKFVVVVLTVFAIFIPKASSFLGQPQNRQSHEHLPSFAFRTVESTDIIEQQQEDHMNQHQQQKYQSKPQHEDMRPYQQRAKGPRPARRLNHAFRYLYRQNASQYVNMSSFDYLSRYYPRKRIYEMNRTFPPLLALNVSRHLHPKIRFLQTTLGISDFSKVNIPPQYFGSRLERTIAPRHAFLAYHNLPHGHSLVSHDDKQNPTTGQKWQEFLLACRKTKRFCALCNQWRNESQPVITPKQIESFDMLFGRGIMAAARDDLVQRNNTWPLQYLPNITSREILRLLIDHGANPLERDIRGVSLLHWAAGTGNLGSIEELLPHFPCGVLEQAERDGATPLHWAAAGASAKEFGTGGHPEVCRYLLSSQSSTEHTWKNSTSSTKELVNKLTFDGNSPLMWASWSGTLETVKLLIRNRADATVANRNGCTVAHWATSGGSLQVCKYLADVVGVDFSIPNYGGNTPLTHAVAFGRVEIVQWLRQELSKGHSGGEDDDMIAANLAQDFCDWTDGEDKRKQILELFQDDFWIDERQEVARDTVDINMNEL